MLAETAGLEHRPEHPDLGTRRQQAAERLAKLAVRRSPGSLAGASALFVHLLQQSGHK